MIAGEVELLKKQSGEWGLALDDNVVGALLEYTSQLGAYDEANVVGTRDLGRLLTEHVLDSLSCLLHEPVRRAGRMIDVGSGGGLPGIPLKIFRKDVDLTLLESTGKKTRFLQQVVDGLSLRGVEVANGRAEEYGRDPGYRGSYDVATARALASLSTLSEYCLPLVRNGGCVVAMKGKLESEELEAGRRVAEKLGAEVTELIEVEFIPELPAKQRKLVIIDKISETPKEYPRRTGLPKKKPLRG